MIKIITGDSATFTFSIVYPGAVDGTPAPDLSDATVVFALKKDKTLVEKTIANPDTNILYFSLSPEETQRLSAGIYDACCKIYYDSGEAKTVWMDNVTVVKGVLGADK